MNYMLYFDGSFKSFKWDPIKDQQLRQSRGRGFGSMLSMNRLPSVAHPTRSNQIMMLFEDQGRVWAVPSVVSVDTIFFKTLYQSRKYTAMYARGELS